MVSFEGIENIDKCYFCDGKAEYIYIYHSVFRRIWKCICSECRMKYVDGELDLKK